MGVKINQEGHIIRAKVNYQEKGDDGLTAYEVSVKNGFEGTEHEWIESLKQPAIDAAETANEAASNANSKAELADQSAQDAISATSNANTATQAAKEAAITANNAKGWQAIESIENYQGKELRYISGWQGGTGEAPTTNVGLYFKVGGGFTDDKDLAVNFKGNTGDVVQASLIYTRDDYNQLPEPRNPNTLYFTSKDAEL